MGDDRSRKEDSSRRRLLTAAKDLLWRQGYEKTSPQDVLTLSGVGKGSLYHHFPGKRDLARAALDEVRDELTAVAMSLLAGGDPPLERLRRWLLLTRDGLKGCRIGRLASESAVFEAALHDPVAAYFRSLEDLVTAAVTEAVTRGELPQTLSPEQTARALIAVIQGGYVLSRAHQEPSLCGSACAGAMAMLDALSAIPRAGD
ncbi:TetR/AcrR family transcriptional regulator [Novispirillum itersonii]|uniref:TetR/AcrR family transcriptional regulator n=1 Tax=Novispirillum itersonii TaxID=189 RepID=UPI000371A89C|nr:TetR/AcrR family transcriptional regulator [Novispirillum itersonii]